MSVTGNVESMQTINGNALSIPAVDDTLTKKGAAADALAVGNHTRDKRNPHGVTKEQLGALGFKRLLTANDDLNDIIEDGVYVYYTAGLPANAPFSNAAVVFVIGSKETSTQKIQIAFRYGAAGNAKFRGLHTSWQPWADFNATLESADHSGCRYRMVDGEIEWINPPMVAGVEYRTTERRNGKVLYTKYIEFGELPASGQKQILYSNRAVTSVEYQAFTKSSTGGVVPIPMINSSGELGATITATKNNLIITVQYDLSAYQGGFAIVKYTKD